MAEQAGRRPRRSAFDAAAYDEAYFFEEGGFLPLEGYQRPSPKELREHALETIVMVNGYVADWSSAVDRLASDFYPPRPRAVDCGSPGQRRIRGAEKLRVLTADPVHGLTDLPRQRRVEQCSSRGLPEAPDHRQPPSTAPQGRPRPAGPWVCTRPQTLPGHTGV
ncbi:hypothetical protein ACGF0D_35275 [Kitasatospora sp. NPDC048298]|uniref:hypothetical protein n=1 Tax=Kitasatospora sp. NPDC048298 TaxID=3364049 RepID=UPI00371CBEA0